MRCIHLLSAIDLLLPIPSLLKAIRAKHAKILVVSGLTFSNKLYKNVKSIEKSITKQRVWNVED